MPATVFAVDVKTSFTAAPGFRPVVFAITFFAMALTAYMPTSACALPDGAGQAGDPGCAITGTTTWSALPSVDPARPRWSARGARMRGGTMVSRALPAGRPASAWLPAKTDEIDPGPAP